MLKFFAKRRFSYLDILAGFLVYQTGQAFGFWPALGAFFLLALVVSHVEIDTEEKAEKKP